MTNNISIRCVGYCFPTPRHPFYHATLQFGADLGKTYIEKVIVDGKASRDFIAYHGDIPSPDNHVEITDQSTLIVRVDWTNNSIHKFEIGIKNTNGKEIAAHCESKAPATGGYWNTDWKYYSAHIVREEIGVARTNEPVHLLLAYYAERLSNPEKEIRVVEIDPLSGAASEISSQVYGVHTTDKLKTDEGQPTTTLECAFLANVAAFTDKVFLVFYGNSKADKPKYVTDLEVKGKGLALEIENSYYKCILHKDSGALDEFILKQGVNVTFDHHVETNGAIHWNPDLYAPPRVWTHASDWAPPANVETIVGPIFCMTKRWDQLPEYPDTLCSVTYVFYAHRPYMLMDSCTEILEDMDVRALRNGELVLNLNVANGFAWKEPSGVIQYFDLTDRPKEPRRAVDFSDRSPWWAFVNHEKQAALASVNISSSSVRRTTGLSRTEPYYTLKWGPFVYCTRPLVYSFNSSNPQRLIHVPGQSSFAEKCAFAPVRLGRNDETRYEVIELLSAKILNPLTVFEPAMEVDERVPLPWGTNFPYPGM